MPDPHFLARATYGMRIAASQAAAREAAEAAEEAARRPAARAAAERAAAERRREAAEMLRSMNDPDPELLVKAKNHNAAALQHDELADKLEAACAETNPRSWGKFFSLCLGRHSATRRNAKVYPEGGRRRSRRSRRSRRRTRRR